MLAIRIREFFGGSFPIAYLAMTITKNRIVIIKGRLITMHRSYKRVSRIIERKVTGTDSTIDCITEKIEFSESDGFKRAELGLSLGGGVNFGKLFLDLRYVIGVSKISEEEEQSVRNKGLQIGLGYMF